MSPLSWFQKAARQGALQGQKVILRAPEPGDFEAWSALRQKSRGFLEKWEPTWSPDEFSRFAFRARVRIYDQRARADEGYTFFIFDRKAGALVGGISLSHVRRGVSQSATLGYWMGQPFARQGYMKDAIQTLIRAADASFGLHRLEAACLPHNEPSRRLLLSCGFQPEGYAKSYVRIAGKWEDHLLFGLVIT
ncbi:MAG: GNAT family N-acetyltransferase [Alphaproteobacteria bacterium]|nr:GNAT family N-acetyltransferase [Alphaproteobacteria bacterium]